MTALREAHPGAAVELWAEDEHRVGLKPITRRVWARRGQRPVAPVHHRYQWAYLYAFVHPHSGRCQLPLRDRVNVEQFNQALADFAAFAGAGAHQHIGLLIDGAGWHRSPKVSWPEGVHPLRLPPYSPELQPAEPLWPLTNEALVNHAFPDLDALKAAQAQRCAQLEHAPEVIRQLTRFHWWPPPDHS